MDFVRIHLSEQDFYLFFIKMLVEFISKILVWNAPLRVMNIYVSIPRS